ncbi:hypothetical protein OG233_12940 [Streptomyces sp. NBC_01218]|uniref:hypothetical protein n=1 Tax=unclassified Streptomyces TaxID=2593676 RepID=UPI002E0F5E79|nr:hypothetical protein OG233_12940 [Streptomyces sp. NBC_01218]
MSDPGPFVVVPGVLWVAAAGVSLITAIVRSSRSRRRAASAGGPPGDWRPLGPEYTWPLYAASAVYAVEALIVRRVGWGEASLSIWWPAFAASALGYLIRRRLGGRTGWATALFAAAGSVLLGPVFA